MSTHPRPNSVTAQSVVGATCLLALLHFGREVLQPIALAVILSLLTAPLLRGFGRLGLPRLPAILATLLLAGTCVVGAAVVLTTQLIGVSDELPQYRAGIQRKLEQLHALAERPFAHVNASLSAITPLAPGMPSAAILSTDHAAPPMAAAPALGAGETLANMAARIGAPLAETGLVLVLLVFILLEHETLQERLVRLAGQVEISRTIRALADAAQGVSRFFLSQLVINATFGSAVGLALWALGVPHALLWGTLSFLLRFVPYLGALLAGTAIAGFAAVVDPGWSLALACALLFGALELLVANLIEPHVYGHSTGMSPLAVTVSALFWGTLWGPVGLLISTPLTVCLVVAGRHVAALEPLTILFGQTPDVTGAQRFFLRGLSGDTSAILRDANPFLRRASFARYCDQILLPGLALAAAELEMGLIDAAQQGHLRGTVAEVAEALAPTDAAPRRRRHVSLLNANVGAHLRHLRETRQGRWQGSLDVPLRSIVLCVGLALERDELVSELLARTLRTTGIDARSIALPLPYEEHDPSRASLVSTIFIPYPLAGMVSPWREAVAALRALLPQALLVTIRLPGDDAGVPQDAVEGNVDMVLRSFEEGLAFVTADGKALRK